MLGPETTRAEYPEKPITIIYPWPAGDPTTAIMRTIGELASKDLGQPIVVNSDGVIIVGHIVPHLTDDQSSLT